MPAHSILLVGFRHEALKKEVCFGDGWGNKFCTLRPPPSSSSPHRALQTPPQSPEKNQDLDLGLSGGCGCSLIQYG